MQAECRRSRCSDGRVCVRTVPSLNHPNERNNGAHWGPRYGTRSCFPLYPALPRWAKMFRACGAVSWRNSFHRANSNRVLTQTLKCSVGMTARLLFLGKKRTARASGEEQPVRSEGRLAKSEERRLQLLHALHVAHAGDFAHAGYDALQVLEVGNVSYQVNPGVVFGGLGFDVTDVGVCVADDGRDLFQHAGTVIAVHRQLYRITSLPVRRSRILSPLDGDAPVRFVHQVGDVGTSLGVHGHSLAPGDIANNVFAEIGRAS